MTNNTIVSRVIWDKPRKDPWMPEVMRKSGYVSCRHKEYNGFSVGGYAKVVRPPQTSLNGYPVAFEDVYLMKKDFPYLIVDIVKHTLVFDILVVLQVEDRQTFLNIGFLDPVTQESVAS